MNEKLAIPKVEEFLGLVAHLDSLWNPSGTHTSSPAYKQTKAAIDDALPMIRAIAAECDPDLIERIDGGLNGGWGCSTAVSASRELLGFLRTGDERRAILAPEGPQLAAARMHPWVWGAVSQLWDDGYHREAVSKAASAIFDVYLPAKVQMPKGSQADAMLGKAFKGQPPFFNIPGFAAPGQDRTNAYEGAQNLGLACSKLVRNLATHNITDPGIEEVLLEELAMLSRFARIVEESAP